MCLFTHNYKTMIHCQELKKLVWLVGHFLMTLLLLFFLLSFISDNHFKFVSWENWSYSSRAPFIEWFPSITKANHYELAVNARLIVVCILTNSSWDSSMACEFLGGKMNSKVIVQLHNLRGLHFFLILCYLFGSKRKCRDGRTPNCTKPSASHT